MKCVGVDSLKNSKTSFLFEMRSHGFGSLSFTIYDDLLISISQPNLIFVPTQMIVFQEERGVAWIMTS